MKWCFHYLLICVFLLGSCTSKDDPVVDKISEEQTKNNINNVLGIQIDPDHDWCMASSKQVFINNLPNDISRVQVLVRVTDNNSNTSILTLNESDVKGKKDITLWYDEPDDNLGTYIAFISNTDFHIQRIMDRNVTFVKQTKSTLPLPSIETPKISIIEDSYASIRGWIPNEKLYQLADYEAQAISVDDYEEDFKDIFRYLIFSYFKNGKNYNNLPLVQATGYYNGNAYPFTTGNNEPILVSPVYKNDGGYKEVENSDFYYYYFKEEDIKGSTKSDTVQYLENLPKYKAIQFNQCIKGDDVICKHKSYALIYWGDETPAVGTSGSYYFPEGYKIGFMVRAKTTAENGKKQGELYSDGRLNNYINFYDQCNFKSSKLGQDGPRSCWMTVNGRMLLCFESGTDRDFNDIILEVEGGVEPIIVIPPIENNAYTFCFEDTEFGDYDMNDIVIKAKRINETTVQYSVVACGGNDLLKIKNINSDIINEGIEVHSMFGLEGGIINAIAGQNYPFITDEVTVSKSFSFLDPITQPYIFDISKNNTVKIARKGEDPHGIMIPNDFKYPLEGVCIKNAYPRFNEWGENMITSTDWYEHGQQQLVFSIE